MQRPPLKKMGEYLGFNSANSEPIFLILEEKELGYVYYQATKPFGPLNFALKESVQVDEEEPVEEEKKDGKSKNPSN